MMSIRLVIADDHPVMRKGMRTLLEDSGWIEIVGEAATGKEALQMVQELEPDVLLLDIEMPDMSGIEVAQKLHNSGLFLRVLVLSAYDDIEYVRRLINCGVAGYLLKDEALRNVVQAVKEVADGTTGWFSYQIQCQLNQIIEYPAERVLTERELEVLGLAAQGKTNGAIANVLQISEKTVEKHLDSIYRKLEVRSRTEAAVTAIQRNLI
jgi:DNA-binding NarL/FixJ family response regulator